MPAGDWFDEVVLTPEYFADLYPYFHRLRAEAPVYWSERLRAWVLTRYDDVQAGLNDPRLNSGERIGAIVNRLPAGERRKWWKARSKRFSATTHRCSGRLAC